MAGSARGVYGSGAPLILATLKVAAINLTAQQTACDGTKNRSERTISAAVNLAAEKRADTRTDDEAGRAVVALTVITSVTSAPDAVTTADFARFAVAPVTIIAAISTTTVVTIIVIPIIIVIAMVGDRRERIKRKHHGRRCIEIRCNTWRYFGGLSWCSDDCECACCGESGQNLHSGSLLLF